MNPFNQFNGLLLNGSYYQKNELERSIQDGKLGLFEKEILAFAHQLFQKGEELTFQTSGSTGHPKNISFSKSSILKSASDTNQFFGLRKGRTALLSLPVEYVAGKMMIARAITGEYELICTSPSSAPLEASMNFNFAPFTPYQLETIIENQLNLLPENAVILLGGSTVSISLKNKIGNLPNEVYLGFGMTETLTHFALGNLKAENFFFQKLPGTEIQIDRDGVLSVFRKGVTSNWIKTTDIVEPVEEGFIWKGRKNNVINSGGVKLHPEEIENELAPHLNIPYFVAGQPDDKLGEKAVLFIECENTPDLSKFSFKNKYSKPKRIVAMKKFLRTSAGKIKRKATVDYWLSS